MDLHIPLQQLGLDHNEAKTYLAMLDLGEATSSALAERTGFGRVHMYQIANKLIEKGAASYILKNNIKHFSAADPEHLLRALKQKEDDLKRILPVLKMRQRNTFQETKAEVYRGRSGINTLLKMIVKDKKPYYWFGGAHEACAYFRLESTIFVKHVEKCKVRGKILAREHDNFFVGTNEDYRFIPKELISTTTQILWGNKTAIFVWSEPYYVLLIENKEIAQSNILTFDYIWKTAKLPSRKDRNERLLKIP
jgi:sugar-specific transcriptional regulator TrmB